MSTSNGHDRAVETGAFGLLRRWLRVLNERQVRALPVIAVVSFLLASSAIIYLGRGGSAGGEGSASAAGAREPVAVRDVDHYVPGSPPAVAERFLRAWFRYRYDE